MIFFKSEANSHVGAGHLQRSITLAREFLSHGIESSFIFAESPPSSINKVVGEGFKNFRIEKELQYNYREYLKIIPPYSLIVFDTDDYFFYSGEIINELREHNIKTACFSISDKHYISTDLLINPNIISRILNYSEKSFKIFL